MWASFDVRIVRRDYAWVHRTFEFDEKPEVKSHASDICRYRGAERLVRKGDVLWARLGAWPYGVALEASEPLPLEWAWWRDEDVWWLLDRWRREGEAASHAALAKLEAWRDHSEPCERRALRAA